MLPPVASAYVVPSAPAFRARPSSPRGGEGLLVLAASDAPADLFAGSGSSWRLVDAAGRPVSNGVV